jgi:hypothetical protein
MSVKSSTELMLYVVLTMPTLNKAYLFIFLFIVRDELCQTLEQIKISVAFPNLLRCILAKMTKKSTR